MTTNRTPNRAFRQRFLSSIRKAVQDADEAINLNHPGLVGRLREICLTQILTPVLPRQVKCGTGQLTDSRGNLSGEIDVILYAPEILPPALFDDKNGIFPVESCLYTIEVKSRLTSSTVASAIESARRVRSLSLLPTDYWLGPTGQIGCGTAYPVNALFAFGTDLRSTNKSEIGRYRELDATANQDSQLKAICACGAGYWYLVTENGEVAWKHAEPSPEFDEIVDFVSGITNTIPRLLSVKGRPGLGHYLSNNRPHGNA